MTERLELVYGRLFEVPSEELVPEPYGQYFRLLAREMLPLLQEGRHLREEDGQGRKVPLLVGHLQSESLVEAEGHLPEGILKEVLFALRWAEGGLGHRHIALSEMRTAALIELFLEVYGAFQGDALPEPSALVRDLRYFFFDYLPECSLSYVERELDLFEEADVPAAPTGMYQEHLLAEAAAVVGHWRVHLTNAKQTIIGMETACIAADTEMLPVAAYVRRMLRGLGVRSSVLVRPPELMLAAPWVAECGASAALAFGEEEEELIKVALLHLPEDVERVLALFLDEAYVSWRLRAEEEALRKIGEEAFAKHVGTLRIVHVSTGQKNAGERYFTEEQRELYRRLRRELSAIRARYMKARPFVCAASVREQ